MPRQRGDSGSGPVSRRALLRTASGAAVAAGAAAVGGAGPMVAQADWGAVIVGNWLVNSSRAGAVPNGTLVSFIPGGGFIRAGDTHPTESPGFGAWTQVGDAEVQVSYTTVQFDSQAKFIGHRKGWLDITIDGSGASFTGRAVVQAIAADGTEGAPANVVITGVRMVTEAFPA